ncbi:MAG: malto-oligosyltrehalose synthase [Omnitrophica bacterium RIFCSPLOWO2_12_FULL_50_11]|nr:MAG: malto-oligosyltrehalose synthase [Omnitrophica bacterium RIFCSPLOWO2_12_FULL_50_11]
MAREELASIYIPSSVYRLHLNRKFTFQRAIRLIPYLKELGIEAVYVSPYFQNTPKCLHGYNVTDPNQINPEIGSEADFLGFCEALQNANIAQILDIVPNHMAIASPANKVWTGVLENGPSSRYARFFDIDWEPEKRELKDKVLLPILSEHYGQVLEQGGLKLRFDGAQFWICYWDHKLPVTAKTYAFILRYGMHALTPVFGANDEERDTFRGVISGFEDLPLKVASVREAIEEVEGKKEHLKKHFQTLVACSDRLRSYVGSCVKTFNGRKGNPKSFDLLDELLSRQYYRLAYWRVAADEINYRRFFNVNELAATRIEDPEVFRHHHELTFQLLRTGRVQGLRIDHPDGLYDPPEYFRALSRNYLFERVRDKVLVTYGGVFDRDREKQKEIFDRIKTVLESKEFTSRPAFYLVAEKILDRKESLPHDWAVHGTTGYDFLNALNGLFVHRLHEKELTDVYEQFVGERINFDDLLYQKKKFFALIHMSSEINALGHRLDRISEQDRRYRDFTLHHLTVAIRETIACFPVYRTYISPTDVKVSDRDERYIYIAIEKAKRKTPALNPAVYDYLKKVLLLELERELGSEGRRMYRDFVLRFQQLTAPIMAKGREDTVFYLYNRLISLNEVGGDPTHFGVSTEDFHRQNLERHKNWPAGLITSTTHDTKRSEDVRMRINVLSEIPQEWNAHLNKWSFVNEKYKTSIDGVVQPGRNLEYFIYQTLIGIWPDDLALGGAFASFTERVLTCVLKSVREAGVFTNWVGPNRPYEEAVKKFVKSILSPQDDNNFLKVFLPFQRRIAKLGMLGSLSSAVIKLTSPGVVDVYQGSEIENYRLVDPDNRGKVDFALRRQRLRKIVEENRGPFLFSKHFLYWCGLHFRKLHPDLFIDGDYVPLEVEGSRKQNVVCFLRRKNEKLAVIACAQFFTELVASEQDRLVGPHVWNDTAILLPKDIKEIRLRGVFTQRDVQTVVRNGKSVLLLSNVFETASVALLTNVDVSYPARRVRST